MVEEGGVVELVERAPEEKQEEEKESVERWLLN